MEPFFDFCSERRSMPRNRSASSTAPGNRTGALGLHFAREHCSRAMTSPTRGHWRTAVFPQKRNNVYECSK